MNKYFVGFLIFVVLSASVYILLPGSVRIDIGKTYSTFKVWENGGWVLAGQEYTKLMDGTTLMRASSREVNYTIQGNITTAYRYAYFKEGCIAKDTYIFDGGTKDVKLFPVDHEIELFNCEGKIFLYEVTKLLYTGITKNGIESPQSFGHKMKVEWEDGNYYSRIYKYVNKEEGKLSIRYRVDSDYYSKSIRLFDPPEDINVTLVSPADDLFSEFLEVRFNVIGNITGDIIENYSLWTNETGTWSEHNYSSFSRYLVVDAITNSVTTEAYTFVDNYTLPINTWVNNYTAQSESSPGQTMAVRAIYHYLNGSIVTVGAGTSAGSPGVNLTIVNPFQTEPVKWIEEWLATSLEGGSSATTHGKWISGGYTYKAQGWNRTNNEMIVWNSQFCSVGGSCNSSFENRTLRFSVDIPIVNISSPENETYFEDITILNYTISDEFPSSCWYSQDYGASNSSEVVYGTNFTGLNNEFGQNNWTVYCNDTENRIGLDNIVFTKKRINYTTNTTESTNPVDFSVQDWIFLEVDVYQINETNISFELYRNGIFSQSINYIISARNYNFTNLTDSLYQYNVTVCYTEGDCYSTDTREYGNTVVVEIINLSLNNQLNNLTSEVGNIILVNVTSNTGLIYLDIIHPEYGINYTTGNFAVGLNLLIEYFTKEIFNDSTTSTFLNYTGEQSKNLFFSGHQYDEVKNMSLNISGVGDPENVMFNRSNTSNINRIFPGFLIGENIFLNKTIFNLPNETLSFSNVGNKSINLYMDDNANFGFLIFNITGSEYGFDFNEFYDNYSYTDTINNEMLIEGGFLLPYGSLPQKFTYDSYNGAIDVTKYTFDQVNGFYYTAGAVGDRYQYNIINTETSSYLKLFIENFLEAVHSGQEASSSAQNWVYLNYSELNIWTTGNIEFDILYEYSGVNDNDFGECGGTQNIFLGLNPIWNSSAFEGCYDYRGGGTYATCYDIRDTNDQKLEFNLTRQINNSWKVEVTGSEKSTMTVASTTGSPLNCGILVQIYNYTSGRHTKDYSNDVLCTDTNVSLANTWYTGEVEWNTVAQLRFKNTASGHYDEDQNEGCTEVDTYMEIYPITQVLFDIENRSYYSENIYEPQYNISSSTLNYSLSEILPNLYTGLLYSYLSADGGTTWEEVAEGVNHNFLTEGNAIRYRLEFNFTQTGYLTNIPFFLNATVYTPKDFPENLTFDFGNDGVPDATYTGELNVTNSPQTITISSADLVSALGGTPFLYDHLMSIPLFVGSETLGNVIIDAINLTYNPNPIKLNYSAIQIYLTNSINFTDFPISVESTGGNITFDDVGYDYLGGNSTINITAHNADYSVSVFKNITYYFSDFYKNLPYVWVEDIFFLPRTNSSKNVSAYGQTNTIPLFNITTTNYGGKDLNLSIRINESFSCLGLKWNHSSTIPATGNSINTTYQEIQNSLNYMSNQKLWVWADLTNCNASEDRILTPDLKIESYCIDCLWGNR